MVRASAAEHSARRAARQREDADRAAEEALTEAGREAKRRAEAVAAEAREAAKASAARDALAHPAKTTARILRGELDVPPLGSHDRSNVLLVHRPNEEADQLARAIEEAGFDVASKHAAVEALDALAWLEPSCVVCDYDLQDASGDAVARQLRKKGSEQALTPFLLLASPADTRTGIARFSMGADVCMLKPYRPAEVVAQIRALVGMAKRLRAARRALPRLEPNRRTGFEGELVQMSITAVLTVLELERRTGTFEVASEVGAIALDVVGGRLVAGKTNGTSIAVVGALRLMLTRKTGRFFFKPGRLGAHPVEGVAITAALDAAMRFQKTDVPVRPSDGPRAAPETTTPVSGVAIRMPRDPEDPDAERTSEGE